MTSLPKWMQRALSPTRREIARLAAPIASETYAAMTDATQPSPAEVDHLIRRLQRTRRSSPSLRRPLLAGVSLGAGLIAASAVAFVATRAEPTVPSAEPPVVSSVEDFSVSVPVGASFEMTESEVVHIGPSIAVRGDAELRVDTAGPGGTVVVLESGKASFDVDPTGRYRHLIVEAGDLRVTVTGTVFEVLSGPTPRVRVTRGSVRVEHGDQVVSLSAGEQYTAAPEVARVIPQTPPPPASRMPALPKVPEKLPAIDPGLVRIGEIQAGLADGTLSTQSAREMAAEPAVVRLLDVQRVLADDLEAAILMREAGSAPAERAVAGLTAFLSRSGDHPRADQLRWTRATLHRDRLGDCASALADYRVLSERHPWSEDARLHAYLGICAYAVGSRDEAIASLKRTKELGLGGSLGATAERFLSDAMAGQASD